MEFGPTRSISEKGSVPVAPENLPVPPVTVKIPAKVAVKVERSRFPEEALVPNRCSPPAVSNTIDPDGNDDSPKTVGSVFGVSSPPNRLSRE